MFVYALGEWSKRTNAGKRIFITGIERLVDSTVDDMSLNTLMDCA